MEAGKTEWGISEREREREREGERERERERERESSWREREMEHRWELEMAWVEKRDHWKRHVIIYGTEQIKRQSKCI